MTSATRIPVYAERVDPGITELCFSAWSCEVASHISDIWYVVAVGVAGALILGTMVYLKAAKEELDEEQSRTAAELEAFREFADQVASLSPQATAMASPVPNGGLSAMAAGLPSETGLETVKESYRETVMMLPHYPEEYGDLLEEHMAEEFGPDIATAVTTSTELSPILQRLIVSKARQSARARDRLMRGLSLEQESIDEANSTVEDLNSALRTFHPRKLEDLDYPTLQDRWEELDRLEAETTAMLMARQRSIRHNPLGTVQSSDGPSLFDYLYQSMDVEFPILATGAEILNQIETSKATVSRIASNG